MDLYRDNILDHYQNPHNWGRLKKPSASAQVANELCGDKLTVDILVNESISNTDQKQVQEIAFEGEGCAISIASASMLTDAIIGKSIHELKRMNADDMVELLGTSLTPTRLKCALISLEAVHKAIQSV